MTSLRSITAETVRTDLTQMACIPMVRDAAISLSAGMTRQASRQIIDLGDGNAVGSSHAGSAEIDSQLIPASLFIPDHRKGVIAQGSEFLDTVSEDTTGPEMCVCLLPSLYRAS
ncbi:hypothetical protein [Parasphingorhabdus halotolerans]|uniref:Uncharacterized protein n=1 Tax=Parasphingorhabdus halotolerans TaxID=2725558 RepID=A0A6H2DKH7_9SPHN|nr:hypothetical protein [Parasphingorhabdus halotolerans]QJB68251.1 hypothetical protein HF685_02150 [Parasphingorhabdus halotolerans]